MRISPAGPLAAIALALGAAPTPATAGDERLRRAGIDTTLLTRAPAVLHSLATATPSLLADNTIRLLAPRALAAPGGPARNGKFSTPFAEPTVGGQSTSAKCVKQLTPNAGVGGPEGLVCKPAAGTLVNLTNGKVLYWDALEAPRTTNSRSSERAA